MLFHDQRIALDGASVETVDAEVKDLAAKHLARHAARKAVKTAGMVKPKPQRAADRNATRDAKAISAQARENALAAAG